MGSGGRTRTMLVRQGPTKSMLFLAVAQVP
jgi:hypothetical protein